MEVNQAVDKALWKSAGHAAPTGTSMRLIKVLRKALPDEPVSLGPEKSPEEWSVELLDKARRVYYQLRDQARHQFEASGSLQVLLDFVKREPYTLHDPWVREVLAQRLHEWDDKAVRSILRALMPKRPKIATGATPQQARDYYRWLGATASEIFLSGEVGTVRDAILRVALSPEGIEKRAEAGMPEAGDDRAREIYYQEAKRYAWRVIVMAGLGLIENSRPDENRQGSYFQGKR
jgi:hypothetical protein